MSYLTMVIILLDVFKLSIREVATPLECQMLRPRFLSEVGRI